MVIKVTCLTLLVLGYAQSAVLPVEKCKLDDSACLKTAFQKMAPIFMSGMPENKVAVLDPLVMDDLNFELAGLKFTLTDGHLKGMKDVVLENVEWDTKKKVINIDYHMNNSIKGHYTADGRILILPITGDGQIKLKLNHLQIKLHIYYDTVKGTDGKDHIKAKKYELEFEVKEGAHYHLTNLFNGNKELSDSMLKFLNENWKQVATEFGKPVVDAAASKIFKSIVNFFDTLPIGDIAIV